MHEGRVAFDIFFKPTMSTSQTNFRVPLAPENMYGYKKGRKENLIFALHERPI